MVSAAFAVAFLFLATAATPLGTLGAAESSDHEPPAVRTEPPRSPEGTLAMPAEGAWSFLANFPPNPGSDVEFFMRDGLIYGVFGTFGGGLGSHVGQRIVLLGDTRTPSAGEGRIAVVADHASANCRLRNPSFEVGLQHDVALTPPSPETARMLGVPMAQLIIDSSDLPGRCHDNPSPVGRRGFAPGGIEIVDLTDPSQPREIHLVRTSGQNHNSTVDDDRGWILYSSTSDSENYIDMINVRSCFGAPAAAEARADFINRMREQCRPVITRIAFEDSWTRGTSVGTGPPSISFGCHDITYSANRLYCAAGNATAIFDVSEAFDEAGNPKGSPLPCDLLTPTTTTHPVSGNPGHPGSAATGAAITDCAARNRKVNWSRQRPRPAAEGVRFLGVARHAGLQFDLSERSDAVSDVFFAHEAEPTPDHSTLLVTDERGGGADIPGASCTPGVPNPKGNGGIHFYDITDPANPRPRTLSDGTTRAVYIADPQVKADNFCTVHVIELAPGENRIFAAWYTQGTRVIDFSVDQAGRVEVREVGSYLLPGTNQWVSKPFFVRDEPDGTRTYYLAANDIERGIDVFTFRGAPNLPPGAGPSAASPGPGGPSGSGQSQEPAEPASDDLPPLAVGAAVLVVVCGAAVLGILRLRRSRRPPAAS